MFSAGTASIQVWDLYSGLELRRFRPVQAGASSAEDHHITALVAGTVHGHQVCIVAYMLLLYLPQLGLLAWMLQHGWLACLGMQLIVSASWLPVSSNVQNNNSTIVMTVKIIVLTSVVVTPMKVNTNSYSHSMYGYQARARMS